MYTHCIWHCPSVIHVGEGYFCLSLNKSMCPAQCTWAEGVYWYKGVYWSILLWGWDKIFIGNYTQMTVLNSTHSRSVMSQLLLKFVFDQFWQNKKEAPPCWCALIKMINLMPKSWAKSSESFSFLKTHFFHSLSVYFVLEKKRQKQTLGYFLKLNFFVFVLTFVI